MSDAVHVMAGSRCSWWLFWLPWFCQWSTTESIWCCRVHHCTLQVCAELSLVITVSCCCCCCCFYCY